MIVKRVSLVVVSVVIAFAFTSCADRNFHTKPNPATFYDTRVKQKYGHWDLVTISHVEGIPGIETAQMAGGSATSTPWSFDAGLYEMTFSYAGCRPSPFLTLNVQTVEPWKTSLSLKAGHRYRVTPACRSTSMRFRVIDETAGRTLKESPWLLFRPAEVKLDPVEIYLPIL